MKRAVAYCRVSKDDEITGLNSLTNQKEFFSGEIIKNGYELATDCGIEGIYADEGISGTATKNRKALLQMLKDAQQKKFDYIFCKQISRFGRNVEQTKREIRLLKEIGVGVIFVTERIDTLNPQHDFLISLFSSLSQEEARVCSDRIKFGLRKMNNDGGWHGNPPYGYFKENKKLYIHEKEAEIVRFIFERYKSGEGIAKITNYLNNNNIPTKKGKKWAQNTVSTILKNPIYTGYMRQHQVEMIDPIAKIQQAVPEKDWITQQVEEIKIIDNELFNAVQDELNERKKLLGETKVEMSKRDEDGNRKRVSVEVVNRTGRYSDEHVFSNLLYCNHCGVGMKRKMRKLYTRKDGTKKEKSYEWCCTMRDMYGKHKCDSPWRNRIVETELFEQVKEKVKNEIIEFISNHDLNEINNSFLRKIISKIKVDANPTWLDDDKDWTSTILVEWNFGLDTTEEELCKMAEEQFEKDHAAGLI